MRAGRVLLIIFGALGVIVGLAALAGGGALVWAYGTQRDDDGFFNTRTERFTTETHAIVSEGAHVADAWPLEGNLGTIRIRVTSADPTEAVFVGIARRRDLERYLARTRYDEVRDIDLDPFRVDYRRFEGGAAPTPPGDQAIWVARAEGSGTQTLTWEVEGGEWSAIVMNVDGSASIDVDASLSGKIPWLLAVMIGLLAFGGVSVGVGALMIYLGARTRAAPSAPAAPAPTVLEGVPAEEPEAAVRPYPVHVHGELTEPLSRWLWLVKWFLAIPHYVVLFFLWIAFFVMSVVAFFAILFTGRYPRGIFDFNVGVLRWNWRVAFYSYSALGTDRYPPFSLEEEDYPARLEVEYPERLSRGLVLVKWWLLAIPHFIVVAFLSGGWLAVGNGVDDVWPNVGWWVAPFSGGLIGVLTLFAGVVLLFTGRYPRDIFRLLMGFNRWVYRVFAYAGLMRDEYPPFRLTP